MTQPVCSSEFDDALAQHYRSTLDLAVEIKALRFYLALRRAAAEAKANFNPSQPRVPRGSADGGQWTRTGGGASRTPQARLVQVRLPSSVTSPAWQTLRATAQGLRAAQARVEAWARQNIPGGLEAAVKVPDAATELVFSLGGEPGRRAYQEWSDLTARGTAAGALILRENLDREIARGTMTREQAEDVTIVAIAAAAAGGARKPKRPRISAKPKTPEDWQKSETHMASIVATTSRQTSFKNRKKVPYGTPGSVRPDLCTEDSCTFEVKNYNIERNADGLIYTAAKQARERQAHLPKKMTQKVAIDVTSQRVTVEQEEKIKSGIERNSGGAVHADDVVLFRRRRR